MRQELPAVAGNAGAMLRHEGHESARSPSLKVEADKALGLGKNEAEFCIQHQRRQSPPPIN